MNRSMVAMALPWALGVLPVVHDLCGPECAMQDAAVIVAATTEAPADAECPLHPSEEPGPEHEADGCTHDHGIVRDAPESTSAIGRSASQPLHLPVAALSSVAPSVMSPLVVRNAASAPIARTPRSLALRI